MKQRRGHGEGTRFQRNGRWVGAVELGRDPVTGRRRRRTLYATTEAELTLKMTRAAGRVVAGEPVPTSQGKVGKLLDDWYADNRAKWTRGTAYSYHRQIEATLKPRFGHLTYDQLAGDVQAWVRAQQDADGRVRAKVVLAKKVLGGALAYAVDRRLVSFNAARAARATMIPSRAVTPLDRAAATRFLELCTFHPWAALWVLGLLVGLRIGEALGLRWTDVDLATGQLRVTQQLRRIPYPPDRPGRTAAWRYECVRLKTAKSRRDLRVPAQGLAVLKRHATRQAADRAAAGDTWAETGLLFATATPYGRHPAGSPIRPHTVNAELGRLLASAGLPALTFHGLRHSAASLLLGKMQLEELSKLLGHSSIVITADLYAHLQHETSIAAAAYMDTLFPALKVEP